jgi:hypothetical protein
MPRVYTTTVGGDPSIVELSTPSQNVERPLVQELTSDIVENTAPTFGLFSWTLAAPLTIGLPAGHAPGVYLAQTTLFMRIAASTGNVNGVVLSWSQPGVGLSTLTFGNVNVANPGLIFTLGRTLESDGNLPIQFAFTPNLVSGTPLGSVTANAIYQSAPLP